MYLDHHIEMGIIEAHPFYPSSVDPLHGTMEDLANLKVDL